MVGGPIITLILSNWNCWRLQKHMVISHPFPKQWLIDCMVFNAVFNSISSISRRPVYLSMLSWSSFNHYSAQYSFPSCLLLPHITIIETTDSSERGMNPVAMTIINPLKDYWPGRGSNQSNISFFHSVFYPSWKLSATLIKFVIVVCKLCQFGRVLNLSLGKGLTLNLSDKIVDWKKLKDFAHDKLNLTQTIQVGYGKICGQGRKCW